MISRIYFNTFDFFQISFQMFQTKCQLTASSFTWKSSKKRPKTLKKKKRRNRGCSNRFLESFSVLELSRSRLLLSASTWPACYPIKREKFATLNNTELSCEIMLHFSYILLLWTIQKYFVNRHSITFHLKYIWKRSKAKIKKRRRSLQPFLGVFLCFRTVKLTRTVNEFHPVKRMISSLGDETSSTYSQTLNVWKAGLA